MTTLEKADSGETRKIRARLMSREDYEELWDDHLPEMENELVLEVIRPDGEILAPLSLVLDPDSDKLYLRMYRDFDRNIMETSVFDLPPVGDFETIRVHPGYK